MFLVSLTVGGITIISALLIAYPIMTYQAKSKKMTEIASYIRQGANAYLFCQIKTILLVTPVLYLCLHFTLGWQAGLTSVIGVFTSLLSALFGMSICVRANLNTADCANGSLLKPFKVAFRGGSVMGLLITGFSLSILSVLFLIFKDPNMLIGFGFGASLAALFAQIGGGIFTKSADVGADIVGKVEANIPEDDPRNPAVIADLVGDNVGDCAGRGADLFQTFSDDIVTGSIVAALMVPRFGTSVIFFPILLQCIGVISSSIGIFATREWKKNLQPTQLFNIGITVSTVFCFVGTFFLCKILLHNLSIWYATLLGIATTLVAAFSTRYYAGMDGTPVKKLAQACKRGPAINIITGLAYGLQSPIISILMILTAILFAFKLSGGLLLAIVAVNIGTDLLISYIMASDAFGPIVDNAAGIAEMSKAPQKNVEALSSLDSVGNTMKAITKSYAMSSGTITSFVLFATYFSFVKINSLRIDTPHDLVFLFLGITLPFLIASLTIGSVAKTAELMVDEVRRQFKYIVGIMDGRAKPDYAKCVDIATKNALKEMIMPGLISIIVPILVGFLFGPQALGALLIGAVACTSMLGPFFNNTGTAWDNAKKRIEDQTHLKGTLEHAASVVGDTVGDPLKDVAGPSLLIFMKLIGMTALLIAPLILRIH
jgi:K(+)-stimulated pyrophosphate-energized sodium pump